MVEGDYGIVLPIELSIESTEQAITSSDKFSIKIFKDINSTLIVSQEYSNISNNTIEFKLTSEEIAIATSKRVECYIRRLEVYF